MKRINKSLFIAGSLLLLLTACKQSDTAAQPGQSPYPALEEQRKSLQARSLPTASRVLDSVQIVTDLAFLSSPECEGRRPGTAGHALAVARIEQRLQQLDADSVGNAITHFFTGRSLNGFTEGKNMATLIKGTEFPDQYIVLTAHYDHLGKKEGAYYAGADDNASGTAAALAIAKYLGTHPPKHSVLVALLDREETGLEGAYALIETLKGLNSKPEIIFNLNLDMLARSDKNELFVCGVRYRPETAEWINTVQDGTAVHLLMGHDGAGPGDDWTSQSDHAAFHKAGIPFLYLGVEDHPDYHKTSDTFEKVNLSRYIENCHATLLLLKTIDLQLK
jgi:hypothetical protein